MPLRKEANSYRCSWPSGALSGVGEFVVLFLFSLKVLSAYMFTMRIVPLGRK